MPKSCSQYAFEDINRFIDREMSADESLAFETHLASCPSCDRQVGQLRAISSVFRSTVENRITRFDTNRIKASALKQTGFEQQSILGNVFGMFGKNIYLKLGSIAAILVISLYLFNGNILGTGGPSAIVSTVDADMSSVMIFETQKEKHTIIWFTES